jgi:transposase
MLRAICGKGEASMLKADYYLPPTAVDLLVFEKLIVPDHYLRLVKAAIDFEPLRQLVADCYAPQVGRGAEDPVRLLKLHFLEFHYDLSDREVIAAAQVNVAFRFFLDFSLESPLPVPSLLSQFRTRLGAERFTKVFNQILRQAREHGLVKDRLRLKDATHLIANIAVPATIQLVAQIRERLLAASRRLAPDEVAAHEARAAEVRQATADLKDEQRLLARVEHLREIVTWCEAWAARSAESAQQGVPLLSEPGQAAFSEALALAHKVLQDREPKAQDKLVSLVDTEARNGKHGDYFTGYWLDLSLDADSELICAVEVLPASGDEGADARSLIETEEAAHGNDIGSLSIDSAGFRGAVLHELGAEESGPQLTVYVPPCEWAQIQSERFQAEDFQLNKAGDELRCPGGQTTRNRTRASHDQGWLFRFRAAHCAACPLREQCLKPEIKHGRTVIKHDYEAEFRAARERAQTQAYKDVRQEHPGIERKLAEIVRWHGGRRVRYRGRLRVKIQYLLTAVVVNCKRLVKLLSPPLHPQPA